ncbi:tetratricopeptide repeat protein [Patescibacteria group bacterium]|nr:tetratricopeptide repeat protein [Patescibacteria group bacterium]MBU4580256.1 tetratricopeptide repeat protein [Patescibacteria group bacterium]
MKNNNLIDLKKFQPSKQDKAADEAEYSAEAELLRRENQEKTRQESALSAREFESAAEEAEEKNTFGKTPSAYVKTFWLKLGRFFLFSLIFLLPLFFLPITIYPIDANKQFLAVFLALASLVCYLTDAFLTRRIVYSKSILCAAAVFFVIAGGISAFFSFAPDNSIYGDLTQADVFVNFIIYALILFLAAVFFKKEDFNKIGIVFLASVVLASILGLLQLLEIYIFPFDFTKNAGFNVFGSLINFVIFISFGFALIVAALAELDISLKARIGLIAAGLLVILNLILINYQPIWILLAVIMAIYAIYKFTFRPEKSAAFSFGSGAPLLIAVIAFLFALVGPSLPKVISMPNIPIDIKPNFSATMNISKEALSGFRILTGTGLATFSSQYNAYRPVELNQSNFWRIKFNQGFSFAGTYLTTAGIIGILSVLFIIFAFARAAARNIEDKKAFVVSFGAFFMILGWFYFPASFVGLVFSFAVLGMLAVLSSRPEELDFSRVPKSRAVAGFALLIIFAAGAISLFYFSGKKYAAAFYFQKGLKEYSEGDMAKSSEDILRALSLDLDNDQYLRVFSQFLILDAQNSRDANIEISKDAKFQAKIADSIQFAKRAAEINPADSENWYNLGDIYEKIINIAGGADSFAESSYRKASELNPKNPDPLIGQARVLMFAARASEDDKIKREKTDGAIDALEKAVKLKSDYAASHFQLGLAYAQAQRKDEAIKEFEFAKALSDFDAPINFQLGILYYNSDDFDKAKIEMENAISQDPNFSNARYVLGLVYDKKGEKNNAIKQFEEILKLNPNSVEVKDIINNLKTKGTAFVFDKPVSSETVSQSLGLPQSDQKEAIDEAIVNSIGD